MSRSMTSTRTVALHPILLAVAPIIFVYSYNRAKIPISPHELILPIAVSLAATAVLWLALGLLLWNSLRAAFIVSLLLVLFFLYGHVSAALGSKPQSKLWLLTASGLLVAGGTWLAIRARRNLPAITVVLNLVAAAILGTNVAPALYAASHGSRLGSLARNPQVEAGKPRPQSAGRGWEASPTVRSAQYPDIYYVILDMYERTDVLKSYYHTDNSDFLSYLRGNGFLVPDRSHSNYAQTYLSLASSLNFTYLDSLAAQLGPESQDDAPLVQMINHSRAAEFLKSRGYTIATFASGYTGTELTDADIHWAPPFALSEFQDVLLGTTILPALLGSRMGVLQDEAHRSRIRYILKTIPRAGRGRHPVFVFAHVVCPHPPFVFDAQGRRPDIIPYLRINQTGTMLQVSRTQIDNWFIANYGPQVTYLDKLVEDMVGRILAESPNSPIIILQGDHGAGQIVGSDNLDRASVERRLANLNAIHLPSPGSSPQVEAGKPLPQSALPAGPPVWSSSDSTTPVNTFRVLFSRYLDTSLALLPDRSYFSTIGNPYRFIDIAHPEDYPPPLEQHRAHRPTRSTE
jgi:hypothetical protein